MTERLYYRDATLLEFDATAIEHVGDARHVVLDRTAFYPTSGGQPHDTGLLGNSTVVDVIDSDDRIVHVTEKPVPLGPVRGAIDAVRRRDHIQQHSAQHLLSALAADRLKWETTSVHFGADHSTIEFNSATISERQLDDLERWANEIVSQAVPVGVTFEDAAAAERTGLRKPSGRSGEIRVVTIAGIDRSACGGTHVSRTAEIGPVLLMGVEKIRGNSRVGFLAGDRALQHARAADRTLALLARELGCAVGDLQQVIPARQLELKTMRDQLGRLEEEIARTRVRALRDAAAPGADGVRRVLHRATDESAALLRLMAQQAAGLPGLVLVIIGASPPTIHVAASADSGVNAGAVLKAELAKVGGRGGGSAQVAQGTAGSLEALETIAAALGAA